MDGFIDLIAGIFGFLYDAIAYLLRGTIESPFGALVLGLFFYSIYKSGKHYNSKCCESDDELQRRRSEEEQRGKKAFTPHTRERQISKALRAYAAMVSSADKGATRIIE